MFFADHPRPHFHATYGEYDAKFDIETLELLAGEPPPRQLRLVTEWAELRREELRANWQRATRREKLHPIEPLR